MLARHHRRQNVGPVVLISPMKDTTLGVLSLSANFHVILQGFVSLRPLPSLPGVGEVTPQTQELLEGKKKTCMRLALLRRVKGYISLSGNHA